MLDRLIINSKLPEWFDTEINAETMFARLLISHRKVLQEIDELILEQFPDDRFSSVEMMVYNYAIFNMIHHDEFFIEPLYTDTFGEKYFDYKQVLYGSTMAYLPKLEIDKDVLSTIAGTKWEEILRNYLFICKHNHDFLENLVSPTAIDGGEKEFNIRPCEHLVSSLNSKLKRRTLSEEERTEIKRVVCETIHLITELKNSETVNAGKIAAVWLDRLMSAGLNHLPLHEMAFDKTETRHGLTSIDEELEAYGCQYNLKPEQLPEFARNKVIVDTRIRIAPRQASVQDGINYNPFTFTAMNTLAEVADLNPENKTTLQLKGFKAYYAELFFQRNAEYDYSHFWVHHYDVVTTIEPAEDHFAFSEDISDIIFGIKTADGDGTDKFTVEELLNTYYRAICQIQLDVNLALGELPVTKIKKLHEAVKLEEEAQGIKPDSAESILGAFENISSTALFKLACQRESKYQALSRMPGA